ncbi:MULTISPECIES: hypothetical protein [Mycolicibacter]|uniref:Integral membrane protein n=2 Tax=Mycolicibacter TaxID=1073531 RepID=A0ABU5XL78_9MYCO|nr:MULTISPECIES: hypothetical protein [unclassified Mycolicibacter]MEB3022944.1 hypothetical protein [Mycolicibacter sp. MYC098]MEB3035136.1 hypothetical protein [Mycolicibacter sp. MYC340]
MITLLEQSLWMLTATQSGSVRVLADITSGNDGTSNGAVLSLVMKGQALLSVLITGWFGWKIFGIYTGGGGGQAQGGAGGGAATGGRNKKLVDELVHYGIALALIVAAYPLTNIILDLAGGLVN